MELDRIDHFVLTVKSLKATCEFYSRILGMGVVTFGDNRKALTFGAQKINLHQAGREFEPKAKRPTPGSGDLCFIIDGPLDGAMDHVRSQGIEILEGPVARTGATGPITSFYFRDPDANLVEVATYTETG